MDSNFKPSMAEVSLAIDFLLIKAESGDQDAQELYQQICSNLWNLIDIQKITLSWEKFKLEKLNKERLEILKESLPK